MDKAITVAAVRALVEMRINTVLQSRIGQAEKIHPNYAAFWRTIDSTVMAGGKRLRPYLTVVGYGKIDDEIIKVAAAQELIHIAMLVHDDIIDKDTVRHGKKNVGGTYRETYALHTIGEQAAHFADSTAILAGDALISEAYRLLHTAQFNDAIKQRLFEQFGTSIYEVMAGELMDVEATFMKQVSFDPISIYRYKTASYSLVGPLLSGAYCAGYDAGAISQLETFAVNAGIAYQIQDDLLGVYGDEDATGKSTTGDLREGKRTLLVTLHEASMNDEQAKRFHDVFGNEQAAEDKLESLKDDMVASGAKDKTIGYTETYCQKALRSLANLPDLDQKERLAGLINSLRGRQA